MKVCSSCFNDLELKQFIITNSIGKGGCDHFCADDADHIEIEEILDFFSEFIGIFKPDKNGNPLSRLIQSDWNLFMGYAPCLTILENVLSILKCSIKNPEDSVSYIDEILECTSYWHTLKEDLKWKSRFLTDIDKLRYDLGWDGFFNKQITLPPTESLFRARIHFKGEKIPYKPSEMGCPLKTEVKGGRANPQGIPYLYLSRDANTTLYETRATYLDDISIGKFIIKDSANIVVVDFTESISAFLNMGNIVEYAKSMLLKKYISIDLSKPIRRTDSELEYIPTQFICEFIRYITGADGILFNSSLHMGGKNIVLFEQDKVECISVDMQNIKKIQIESSNV